MRWNRGLFAAALVFLALLIQKNSLAENVGYLHQLIDSARAAHLANYPEWLKLVHYKPDGDGWRSDAESRVFFNASSGRGDPAAELEATLAAFFSDAAETATSQNPQCQFIARYHWLRDKLNFDAARLKPQSCKRFDSWYATINPYQLTLIFPAATDNSPSSMFGHTLIRIDKRDQDERSRLFSYSINYAANTTEANGLAFAILGLTGGYMGTFSIMPYYEKVTQYNQLENRDIWEYQLDFNQEEIRRMLEHTWELGKVEFRYFFFLQNCSYQLLELLDVARPGMDLAENFDWYAIPSDTVRVLLQQPGILKKTTYRPSERTRLKLVLADVDSQELGLIRGIASGRVSKDSNQLTQLPEAKQSKVLEAAYDYLRYQYRSGTYTREQIADRSLQLLSARNKLAQRSEPLVVPTPLERFDQGHGTSRVALSALTRDNEDMFEFRLRPAYHDLLDSGKGYTAGAQINFFDFALRYNLEQEKAYLQHFTLIDIFSLTTRDKIFSPLSWKVNTGFERLPIVKNKSEDSLLYLLNSGAGVNYNLANKVNAYFLLDSTLIFHKDIKNNYALSMGSDIGVFWEITPTWKIAISNRYQYYFDNLQLEYIENRLEQSFVIDTNMALRLKVTESGDIHNRKLETMLSFHGYF